MKKFFVTFVISFAILQLIMINDSEAAPINAEITEKTRAIKDQGILKNQKFCTSYIGRQLY